MVDLLQHHPTPGNNTIFFRLLDIVFKNCKPKKDKSEDLCFCRNFTYCNVFFLYPMFSRPSLSSIEAVVQPKRCVAERMKSSRSSKNVPNWVPAPNDFGLEDNYYRNDCYNCMQDDSFYIILSNFQWICLTSPSVTCEISTTNQSSHVWIVVMLNSVILWILASTSALSWNLQRFCEGHAISTILLVSRHSCKV